jgi:class 3 adenylate cyclase
VAERRVCSVVFCDLVGFTPLAEARDPEAVRELLSAYLAAAREIIGRYGGVTEKFIGDAVMAVWGTPAATEQDAERAVRAVLDLVAAVSQLGRDEDVPQLAARAGVVTGPGRSAAPEPDPIPSRPPPRHATGCRLRTGPPGLGGRAASWPPPGA